MKPCAPCTSPAHRRPPTAPRPGPCPCKSRCTRTTPSQGWALGAAAAGARGVQGGPRASRVCDRTVTATLRGNCREAVSLSSPCPSPTFDPASSPWHALEPVTQPVRYTLIEICSYCAFLAEALSPPTALVCPISTHCSSLRCDEGSVVVKSQHVSVCGRERVSGCVCSERICVCVAPC